MSAKKADTIKWHPMSEVAAIALSNATTAPGYVYTLPVTAAPDGMQRMPGASAYYVSASVTPQALAQGVTVGGEMLMQRIDGARTTAYGFVFATSSNGGVYFGGPYKNFDGHHLTGTQVVPVTQMFGNTPLSNKSGT